MSEDQTFAQTDVQDAVPPIEAIDDAAVAVAQEPSLDDMAVVSAPAETARLVVKRNGVETDVAFEIHPPCVIGRFDPAVGPVDIDMAPLPEGVYVSRKHARIVADGDAWIIEDLQSSNGTFLLNGSDFERVESAEITDGAEIALGNARFVFHV